MSTHMPGFQNIVQSREMAETLVFRYSPDSTRHQELSNEYHHDRVKILF